MKNKNCTIVNTGIYTSSSVCSILFDPSTYCLPTTAVMKNEYVAIVTTLKELEYFFLFINKNYENLILLSLLPACMLTVC